MQNYKLEREVEQHTWLGEVIKEDVMPPKKKNKNKNKKNKNKKCAWNFNIA